MEQLPAPLHFIFYRIIKITMYPDSWTIIQSNSFGRWTWTRCGNSHGAGVRHRFAPTAGACCWATFHRPRTAGTCLF